MLIALAGLPASGKSTLGASLARVPPASILSVDPIEAASWRADVGRDQPTGLAAYIVAEVCSDSSVHRRRLETRDRGIDGFGEPTWEAVEARRRAL